MDLFSLIASCWAEIGVTLELQPTDEATIRNLERTRGHTHMIPYEGSSPHPGEAIWASWVSDGEANLSIVNDPYIDETYKMATRSTDPAEQARLFKELGQYAAEGMNYIVLPGENGTTYAWPWIKNYAGEIHARRLNGGDAFKYAWVDQQLKESMGF